MLKYSLTNFISFMTYIKYAKPIPSIPQYSADPFGNVYNNSGVKLKQFNSNGYKQVLLFDSNHNRIIKGVHQLIGETFLPDFYDGCIIHHHDENKQNNCIENLEVMSRSNHARMHANPYALIKHIKENGPHNKGQRMSDEFREKCHIAALKRCSKSTNVGL